MLQQQQQIKDAKECTWLLFLSWTKFCTPKKQHRRTTELWWICIMLKITAKCGKLPANHKTIRPFDYTNIRPTNLKNYYVGKKIILTNVDIMTRSKKYYKIYIKHIYIHIAIRPLQNSVCKCGESNASSFCDKERKYICMHRLFLIIVVNSIFDNSIPNVP